MAADLPYLYPYSRKDAKARNELSLWYAHDGFGCGPHARGRSIRATCLGDGEMPRWNRSDFTGVLDEQYLPDWVQEKLEELSDPHRNRITPPLWAA